VSDARVLGVLIPAVGGQGGGVLLDWIVDAALIDGYPVHGTSIPGVAQRTGSTTYYVELAPERDAEPPVFSLYPVPGALDVLLAAEFLEVGRMIELGFPSPARTTIVASTHRLYSIHEKIATGRGIYPAEDLARAARTFSRALYAFDALALAKKHSTEANAVLLGALAGSGALPIRAAAYQEAIRTKGVQVDANLRGFDAGLAAAERIRIGAGAVTGAGSPGSGTPFARDLAPAPAPSLPPAAERMMAGFPEPLRPTLAQAIGRLTDYQSRTYAARYLERLRAFVALGDAELTSIVARNLAVWMTYEDAIRVAQLKTRWSRFERIRREKGVSQGEIVVTDYLKPDLDEIWGILPRRLVAPFARWAERRWPRGRPTLAQHVRTTTVAGYLRVWLLALLRPLRSISYRAHEEHARMERWLAAVLRCAAWDRELAREVARAAGLVKGYGDVRRRMAGHFDRLLAGTLAAAERGAAAGTGFDDARALAARYRTLVLQGPDGETQAAALAGEAAAR
jgi:indolepyruvate ferredoxin oxidoreductase beta subunit